MINQTENNFLDVSKLLSGETREIPFDLGPLPFSYGSEEISVSSLRFSGSVQDVSGSPRLIGTLSGLFCGPCGRCLAPVEEEFAIETDVLVVTAPSESEEETVLAEGQTIDLDTVAQETVLIHLPLRLLCREDCQGLCPRCGKDLNLGPCTCDGKEIDPRLAGLADFFKDK